jgi:hypothetical protein
MEATGVYWMSLHDMRLQKTFTCGKSINDPHTGAKNK